jgi:non-ribosomal peptide synthetase component F
MHEMFEDYARRTPNAVAVEVEDEKVSYGELNRQANQLAHYLQDCGVKPDIRVALCLERSVEMVVAMLAVSKAGGREANDRLASRSNCSAAYRSSAERQSHRSDQLQEERLLRSRESALIPRFARG